MINPFNDVVKYCNSNGFVFKLLKINESIVGRLYIYASFLNIRVY
jgi:hypothetical protein